MTQKPKTANDIAAVLARIGPVECEEGEQDAFSDRSGHYTRGTGEWLIGFGETTYPDPGPSDKAETTVTEETLARISGPQAQEVAEAICRAVNEYAALRKCAEALQEVVGQIGAMEALRMKNKASGSAWLSSARLALSELNTITKEAKG